MYPRRGHRNWFRQDPWQMNDPRGGTYPFYEDTYQFYEEDSIIPNNRAYNGFFDNCRNFDRGRGSRRPRGHFHNKRPYRGRSFKGSNSSSKGTSQKLPHSSSFDKPNSEAEDGDQQLCCSLAVSPSSPRTLESVIHCRNETKIDLGQTKSKKARKATLSASGFSFRLPDCSAPLQNQQEGQSKIKKETELLEKETTQDHAPVIPVETSSSLPETSQDLLTVLPPVRTEESTLLPREANSEDTCSPHQPSDGEKTSSSAVPWTPKDRSVAVLAKKEAIEEPDKSADDSQKAEPVSVELKRAEEGKEVSLEDKMYPPKGELKPGSEAATGDQQLCCPLAVSPPSPGTLQSLMPSTVETVIDQDQTKPDKKADDSEKVEPVSVEPKRAEEGKEASLEDKTYPPKGELKPDCEAADGDQQLCCPLAVSPSSPGTLECLIPCRDETEIDLSQMKIEDNEATEDPSKQTAFTPSAKVSTEEPSEITEDLPTVEKEQPVLQVDDKDTQAADVSPELMASFHAEDHLSETTERLPSTEENNSLLLDFCHVRSPQVAEMSFQCETENEDHKSDEKERVDLNIVIHMLLELMQTKITDSHKNSDNGQEQCASNLNAINHQHAHSNIRCVPVLVSDTRKRKNQPWETADDLRGWAPEDYQDPPWNVNQAGKCDNVSENDRESIPSGSLAHTCLSCDDSGRLLERHSSSPMSHCSSGSNHSSRPCASKKLYTEDSESSWRERCSLRSPHRQERNSRSPHKREPSSTSPPRQKHDSGSHRQECDSRSPHRKEYGTISSHRRQHRSGSPRRKEHCSRSSHMSKLSSQDRNLSPPQRRRDNSDESGPCWHCKHSCSSSQKTSSDSLLPFSGKVDDHHSPQERGETYTVSHHHLTKRPTVKRKRGKEKEPEKPAMKKKTTLVKRMKSTKQSKKARKATLSASGFSFRLPDCSAFLQNQQKGQSKIKKETDLLEMEATQDHASVSPVETSSSLPEASQHLLTVLLPVRTEESTLLRREAISEDMCSPHQPSDGEKTSSSAVPWTPKDRSVAVLAKKEAIEEAYLQVLLNFAGVATMLVEKAPCMQEAMDSALRANLRMIGDDYVRMLTNYIDSLAEAI